MTRVLRLNLKAALYARDLEAADGLLDRLKREDPLALASRGLELEYLLLRERLDEAQALAAQLIQLFPASARIHYLAGRVAYGRRDYRAAVRAFGEANDLHPHWRARRWLGKASSQLGQLDEAEATLLALVADHPLVHRDLAWVYERRDDAARALHHANAYLELHPDDSFVKAQRMRLMGRTLDTEELIDEVETLEDLGEAVPREILPTYVERLLASGRGADARRFVASRCQDLPARELVAVAWAGYHLQAYDLALELFLRVLSECAGDVKFLAAIESAAIKCRRVAELVEHYTELGTCYPRLYGRCKRLRKHLDR